ncbi:MAG TPA: glycerophosphodiester phosphodiesterase family protein [Chitinophagales bacterium]|nr:glycerophosphodiester phosphodiesterase family protein [Chitinophagales bacterium]HRK28645.1 glycerophosphodiester phosphodiesterase family protein [Chitinophagales bacterium]
MTSFFRSAYLWLVSLMPMAAQTAKEVALPPHFSFQGHRGARGLAPENTVPAFLTSQQLGIYTLELDVVISADEQVVVSHEPWFNPVICSFPDGTPLTPDLATKHIIYQMPYEQVKQYDCGLRGNPKFPQQQPQKAHKPLLSEVIQAADAYAAAHNLPLPTYNIELKTENGKAGDGIYQPAPEHYVKLVQQQIEFAGVQNRVIVQSFDVRILQAYHQLYPQITLSYLVANANSLTKNLQLLGFSPPIYSPNYLLASAKLIRNAHKKGIKVIAWTVNDTPTMLKLIHRGIDGIITDYPNLAAQILQQTTFMPQK